MPTWPAVGAVPAISVEGVDRNYGSLHVLEDVSFTAGAGELVSLVGPNGAGKTTLIRCISDGQERSGGQRGDRGQSPSGACRRRPACASASAANSRRRTCSMH